jgi:hypothetical protein
VGVAVLRHRSPHDYVLAELLPCRDGRRNITKQGQLFLWWSSGCYAGQWISRKVNLPLRSMSSELPSVPGITHLAYNFHADTLRPIESRGLCWFDLLQGALICDDACNLIALGSTSSRCRRSVSSIMVGRAEEYQCSTGQ